MLRALLTCLLFTFSITVWSANIEGVRLAHSNDGSRLVIDLNDNVKYKAFTLAKPYRLVIDLSNTSRSHKLVLPEFTGSSIQNIRYAQRKSTLRLVLDLNKITKYNIQRFKPDQNNSHRIVIDLYNNENHRSPIVPVTPTRSPVPDKPIVNAIPKKQFPKRDIVIAIDAGHGGKDNGASGRNGTKEKDIVLIIAKRLASLIDAEPGMRPYLVRSDDTFFTLRQRINRAHKQKADMFISIHADAFLNDKARGASVYVLSSKGASSEAAQVLADKENAADLVGGISLEDKDDLLASVLIDLSQTASLEASVEVANTVLSGLKRIGHVHKKQVESAAFVVLKSPDIPSILVETAFISNADEERKLNTSSHQNKLARAMMSGIKHYFERNPLPETNVAQQHVVSSGETLNTISLRYQVTLSQLKKRNGLNSSLLKVGDVLLIP